MNNIKGEMHMKQDDWVDLSCVDNNALRAKLTDEIIVKALQEQLGLISQSIETMRLIFLSTGLKVTDSYIEMSKKYAFTKDETLINPRVRLDTRYKTPSFFWEKTIRHVVPLNAKTKSISTRSYEAFVRVKGVEGKRKMRVYLLSKHVPINRRTQMTTMSNFENEPTWAKLAAELIEPKLTLLRKLSGNLSNINRQILALNNKVGGLK